MRIGIDASRAARAARTGTENVSFLLLQELLGLPEAPEHTFVLYADGSAPDGFLDGVQNAQWREVKKGRPWLWHFSRQLRKDRRELDVLFVPSHIVPFFLPLKTVTMIHGLEWDSVPGSYDLGDQWTQFFSTYRAVQRCETILTPSEATRDHLLKWSDGLKITPRNIEVAWHGPPAAPEISEDLLTELTKRLNGKKFFVFVGRHDARKNLPRLVRAFFDALHDQEDTYLVLAGGEGSGSGRLSRMLSEREDSHRVVLPGHVSDEEKAWLLQHAIALTYPSYAEGFGLPLLEAFKAECPVIASDIPVLREVAGDAALFVDPKDDGRLVDAMSRLCESQQDRERLIQQGTERLQEFSWKKSAQITLRTLVS